MKYFPLLLLATTIILSCIPDNDKDPLIGTWQFSEERTSGMEEKEMATLNSISIEMKEKGYYIRVKINQRHICGTEGFGEIKGQNIYLDTSSVRNKDLGDFTNAAQDLPCKLTINKNENSLSITSESDGCHAECGAGAQFVSDALYKNITTQE